MAAHPRRLSRRQVLGGAVAGGVGLAAGGVLGSGRSAAAALPAGLTGTIADVQHVVFLMMENRSFDEYFGTLSGVRGFDDRSVVLPGGASVFAQPDPNHPDGHVLPLLLSNGNDGQNTYGLSHDWGPQHASWNGGAMDSWITAHTASDGKTQGPITMGYYSRNEIPYHYALADAFTIQDHYHCAVMGPTFPNRLMWQTGSIDPAGLGGGPVITTDTNLYVAALQGKGLTYETYPERLERAGIDWRVYTDATLNVTFNMLTAFAQYQDPTTDLHARGLGNTSAQLLTDIRNNTLPQVSWIFPGKGHTEHPNDGTPNTGPTWYAPIIQELMTSPSWPSTVLFVTWDENDGYFDHVPPPTAPAGTPGEWLTHPAFGSAPASTGPTGTTAAVDPSAGYQGPVGLGFRVPHLIVSPWTRGGYVNSETSDHLSALLFVEKRFGVEVGGICPWRRSVIGDLTSSFDFTRPDLTVPDLTAAFAASHQSTVPGTQEPKIPSPQVMPTQERGMRRRRGPAPRTS